MAFVSQNLKKELSAMVREVLPEGWKVTFGVDNHSSFVMNIKEAPIPWDDLVEHFEYLQLNHYHPHMSFKGKTLETIKKILNEINTHNYDNSEVQFDHFDVGYYVDVNFGKWNKPFVNTIQWPGRSLFRVK